MSIASFSIRQRVLVNLITIVALVVGVFVTINMRREAMPLIQVDYVFINTVYPGASPFEVEKLVTIPIEDELSNIDGIEKYSSVSRESVSFIFIELEPDISNRDRVITEISREADKVELPEDAEDPDVKELKLENPLIEVSFTGDNTDEYKLREYVRGFEEIIKNLDGMGSIGRVGWRDREISIEVDPDNLESYYMSLFQVINAIQSQNVNLPGGKLKSGTKEMIIRTVGELKDADEFKKIIIRTNSDGKYLYVGDIADVRETFEEQRTIYKTDGKVSINLIPKKKRTGDTIKLVDRIKKEVKKYEKTLPEDVSIKLVNDMAFYVKRRLNVLVSNGFIGLFLLICTLLVFLNSRVALVTALGIPFAFLTALIFMSFFNVSLNLITMFGLILVLGMIVDDAIIVSENVYRYMENGMPVKEAAVKGANEVAAPVTATILTTAAAFLPLMFISGIMGKFLRFFPMGVIFCLSASLFEALVILPTHLADWVKPLVSMEDIERERDAACQVKDKSVFSRIILFPCRITKVLFGTALSTQRKGSEARWFKGLIGFYRNLLVFAVNRRYKMTFAALLVLAGAVVFSVKIMPFKLFPNIIEMFYVRVETPEGTALDETGKVLSKIEHIIMSLEKSELDNVTATVGFSGEIGGGPFDKHGTQYAQAVVYLTPAKKRQRTADEIIASLRQKIELQKIPNMINLEFEKVQHGPPVGKPIDVEVRGDEYDVLLKIAGLLKENMEKIIGVEDVKITYELDKEEIQVNINKREAARLGLNVLQVASTIRYAFEGGIATTVRKASEDIDVIVRLPEEHRNSISTLKNLTIPNNTGRLIKLNKVAEFKRDQGVKTLNHSEGKRTISVKAEVDENKITSMEANRRIRQSFSRFKEEYPEYYFKSGGEWEDTTKSIKSLFRAFGIAFMLIYTILATQFKSFVQPLIIMTSVPFGIIGVILALFLHGQPISMMALFGIIGLTGVVVNDALILVNFINKRRLSGMSAYEAVVDAGITRLRPIMLTSITTIIALLPLIYGIGGEEPFLVPAAIAMAYGLLAATFLTLVIVPCVYLIISDISSRFKKTAG